MESLNRLSQSIQQAISQFAALRRERDELRMELGRVTADGARIRRDLETRLSEAMALVERLRDQPPVDGDMMERVRRAELEAAQFAQDLETLRQRQEAERSRLRSEMNALQAESEMHRRQAMEAQAALEHSDSIVPVSPAPAPEMEALQAQLGGALAEAGSLKAQLSALEEELSRGARPEQAAQWLERIASLEARLRELLPLQERQADLDRERLAARAERRKAAAYLKERAGIRRRLEEVHQQLEALKLT